MHDTSKPGTPISREDALKIADDVLKRAEAERIPPSDTKPSYEQLEEKVSSLEKAYEELMAKLGDSEHATTWEATHQLRILKTHGLDEEFNWGCDSIDMVANALVGSRSYVKRLEDEIVSLKERLHNALHVNEILMASIPPKPLDYGISDGSDVETKKAYHTYSNTQIVDPKMIVLREVLTSKAKTPEELRLIEREVSKGQEALNAISNSRKIDANEAIKPINT